VFALVAPMKAVDPQLAVAATVAEADLHIVALALPVVCQGRMAAACLAEQLATTLTPMVVQAEGDPVQAAMSETEAFWVTQAFQQTLMKTSMELL